MNHEEHDELWELLGKARVPKERPFFAAKVLNAIRTDSSRDPQGLAAWWQMLRRRWAMVLATGAAAVFTVIFSVAHMQHLAHQTTPVVVNPPVSGQSADPLAPLAAVMENADDLATSLDSLIANQDNSIWLLEKAPSSPY